MKFLKITIFALLALFQVRAMELQSKLEEVLDSSSVQSDHTHKQSAVPSLQDLALLRVGSLLINNSEHVSIEGLGKVRAEAKQDCARLLAQDQRVHLWKKFGMVNPIITLDHHALIEADIPANERENTVYAALFTPDDKYLITLTTRKVRDEAHCVVYAWRTSDIYKGTQNREANINERQNQEPAPPLKPCSQVVLGRLRYSNADDFKITCDSTGNLIFIALAHGDCHLLQLSSEGLLERIMRMNILPEAQEMQPLKEGTVEEERLDQAQAGFYIKEVSFAPQGKLLLLHVARHSIPRTASLYCLNLEQVHLFAPLPFINPLGQEHLIAKDVEVSTWTDNNNILYSNLKNYRLLHEISQNGDPIEEKELQFNSIPDYQLYGITEYPLKIHKIQLRKNAKELYIFSSYDSGSKSGGYRIDSFNFVTGVCTVLHDIETPINLVDHQHNKNSAGIQLLFLPGGRFAIKLYILHWMITLDLWDLKQGTCSRIGTLPISSRCSFGQYQPSAYVYALSATGSHLFIADQKEPFGPGGGTEIYPPGLCSLLSLETPHSEKISLEELLATFRNKCRFIQDGCTATSIPSAE